MKRRLSILMLICVFISCSKDHDPIHTPIPQSPSQEEENPHAPNQETVEVTSEDMSAYFLFDTSKSIAVALDQAQKTKELKLIHKKKIQVNKVQVIRQDEQEGTFELAVQGLVNGTSFDEDFAFVGFAKKPDTYYLGSRSYAQWKVDEDVYLKEFDLEGLLTGKKEDLSRYTLTYLKDFISFYSFDSSGTIYPFSEEELNDIEVSDLSYEAGYLQFTTRYKGVKSLSATRLPMDKKRYYASKLGINKAFVATYYMHRVYQNLDVFYSHLLTFDFEKYVVELVGDSKSLNSQDNSLSFTVRISLRETQKELVEVEKTITGFKPLGELKKDLLIASSADLQEHIKNLIQRNPKEDRMAYLLKSSIGKWIQKAQIGRVDNGHLLDWVEVQVPGGSVMALVEDANLPEMEKWIYLERPIFELISYQFIERNLWVKVKLAAANEVALDDVVFEFRIHNVKSE